MYANRATERAQQDIIRLCHSGLDSRALRVAVFEKLQGVMPYAVFWCATTDPSTLLFTGAVHGGLEVHAVPALVSNELLQEDFNKFTDLAKSRQPVSTLQLATRGDLTRSPRYREILEPHGLGNELRAVFRSGGPSGARYACIARSASQILQLPMFNSSPPSRRTLPPGCALRCSSMR
ncbi:MAG TPA: hypothetical protein VGF38_06735 [Ktedonobacterales bacterium]|jgi:hypothetical protein